MEHRRPRRGRRHVLGLLDGLQHAYAACESRMTDWDAVDALGEGAGQLARGDEVCLISEFAQIGDAFRAASGALSDIRTLRAVMLEDPLTYHALPGGAFPTREPRAGAREVLRVDPARGAAMTEVGEDVRAERRRALQDLGWHVADALSILPRRERGAA